jgi:hypothetical protein
MVFGAEGTGDGGLVNGELSSDVVATMIESYIRLSSIAQGRSSPVEVSSVSVQCGPYAFQFGL